jgi:CheY-like chemotaxis protein
MKSPEAVAPNPGGEPTCILLADDEPNDIALLEYAFERAGLGALLRRVPDGQSAIDYVEGKPPYDDRSRFPLPGLVLVDLNMPKVSGLEFLEWLRRFPEFSDLPVVIFSGSQHHRDMARASELGARNYIVKPNSSEDLTRVAHNLGLLWKGLHHGSAVAPPLVCHH